MYSITEMAYVMANAQVKKKKSFSSCYNEVVGTLCKQL